MAKGIVTCVTHPAALDQDFNLSTPVKTTVLELAELIWGKIHTDGRPFRFVTEPAYPNDVQRRVPSTDKARDLLGFQARTGLSTVLDEVIPWVRQEIELGRI